MSQAESTWGTALAEGIATLTDASPTPKLDASVLLAHMLDVPRTALFAYPERALTTGQHAEYAALLARRATGEPVAYLVGYKEFMGMRLAVDRRVLVPRPETELVVEAALGAIAARFGPPPDEDDDAPPTPVPDLLAADVGTGSGAIAIALAALEPRLGRIYAVDVSADALAVARHNGDRNDVGGRVSWLLGDLLAPVPVPVDLIVANLPYIGDAPDAAAPNVVAHEPHVALFGEDGGLGHIRRLVGMLDGKLRPGGMVVLEFGFDQGPAVRELLGAALPGAQVTISQDYAGWDRIAIART